MSIKISVTHAQESDEDIFKPGNILVHRDDTNFIVSVTDKVSHHIDYFCGNVLNSDTVNTGMYNEWHKRYFVKFTGTITMEQGK